MNTTEAINIRMERPDDAEALASLAALDSTRVPAHPLLLAEVDGVLRAALSPATGETIADPFERSEAVIELLELVAAGERPKSPWRRMTERLLLWEQLWARARPGHVV
jgi:hypothetical protein